MSFHISLGEKDLFGKTLPTHQEWRLGLRSAVIRHPDLMAFPSSQRADKQEELDKDGRLDGQGQAEEGDDLSLEPCATAPVTGAGL